MRRPANGSASAGFTQRPRSPGCENTAAVLQAESGRSIGTGNGGKSSRSPACEQSRTGDHAPEKYAGAAIEAMYAGDEPDPPLTDAQKRDLMRSGFIARRHGERGEYFILTRKGEELAEDIAAERDWLSAPQIRGVVF